MSGAIGGLALLAAVVAAACVKGAGQPRTWDDVSVPLVNLLSQPRERDRDLVQTYGYLLLQHEGSALYASEDSLAHRRSSDALLLWVGWPVPPQCLALNRRKVRLRAVYSAAPVDHWVPYPGSLSQVREVVAWPAQVNATADCNLRWRYDPVS